MTSPVLATTLATPVGDMSLLVQDDALIGAGFTPVADQFSRLATSDELREVADLGPFSAAMRDYFAGNVSAFDDLPVEQPGGAFRQAAWKVMREVPAGEVISYAELAARAGNPNAVRAAGSACAQNRVAPIVPCHRITGSDGSLTGYLWGLDRKRWLLDHERRHAPVAGGVKIVPA